MSYKIGVDRKQLSLMPICLDEYIPEEHICRVINAFTEQLNLSELGFKYADCKTTGNRPYDPRMMLNLYIYGYLHRVRSSRRLEAETTRNIEVMWLINDLKPDDKTICNFRTDNTQAIKATFREFVQMLRKLGLYGEEVAATDSTKFRAQNSLKHHYNQTVIEKELTRIEKMIEEYMAALEAGDKGAAEEEIAPSGALVQAVLAAFKAQQLEFEQFAEGEQAADAVSDARSAARPMEPDGSLPHAEQALLPQAEPEDAVLASLKERQEELGMLKERVAQEGEVSLIDGESRVMRSGGDARRLDVCYNAHTIVDSKYHLVIDFEVSSCSSDAGNLAGMSDLAKEALEVAALTNLADKGYYDGQDIAACEGKGVTILVAKPAAGGVQKEKGFRKEDFEYDRERDRYICPCKQEMEYKRTSKKNNDKEYRVYANYAACKTCPVKDACTTYDYREIWRLTCQDILDLVEGRTTENKELYRKRQEIVEHVFGTVKSVWGYKQYLCRGKEKVTAETALAYLAYNMRRAVNIFKESKLIPVIG